MASKKNKKPPRYEDTLSMGKLFAEMGLKDPSKNKSPPTVEHDENQESEEKNQKPTCLLDSESNHDRYRIMNVIGTSAINGSLPVYKAAYIALHYETYETMNIHEVFVSVKYIKLDQEPDPFLNLRALADRNGLIPEHENLMGIKKPFIYKGCFCVVFPFMELGSLRSIMASKYPRGFPEPCILVALKEALKALVFIHGNGAVHREINAGHIFFNGKPEIKLAYSASVYEHGFDQDQQNPSPYLPEVSICNWAAAPEIYSSENYEYSRKCDIWLFGVTALELAYGGVKVESREEFESMVQRINTRKRLPEKGGGGEKKTNNNLNLKKLLVSAGKKALVPSCVRPFGFNSGNSFSVEFEEMVVKCLDLDPAKRPTAEELLSYKIFARLRKDVFYFHSWLKNGGKIRNEDLWPRISIN